MSNQVNNPSAAPHPNAEVIKAWADGKVIQFLFRDSWRDYIGDHPDLGPWASNAVSIKWRVKPETKPDTVLYWSMHPNGGDMAGKSNLALTFDGETGELKSADVLKQG